jgi:peptidoglycan/LPS O-acetylase OafA/YrhL
MSNLYLVSSSDGYFSARIPYNPFVQTWSLGLEEQFYFIYPIIVFLLLVSIWKNQKIRKKVLLTFLVSMLVISFAYMVIETQDSSIRAFYLLPSRLWELLLGGLLFIALSSGNKLNTVNVSIKKLIGYVGAILITFSLFFAEIGQFPFYWAIPPVLGSVLVLASGFLLSTEDCSSLKSQFFQKPLRAIYFVGIISYSLYLWHWGVIVLFNWTVGVESIELQLIALILTFVISLISYKFVESKFQQNLRISKLSDSKVFIFAIIATLFTTVSIFGISKIQPEISLSKANQAEVWMFSDGFQSVQAGDGKLGPKHIFLVGDSHAGHLKFAVSTLATEFNSEFTLVESVGCPILGLMNPPQNCESSQKALEKLVEEVSVGDLVIFSSLNVPRIAEQWEQFDLKAVVSENLSPQAIKNRNSALASAIPYLENLKGKGANVIFAAPTPVFSTPFFRCLDWFNSMNPVCQKNRGDTTAVQLQLREPVMESYMQLERLGLAEIWDPFWELCDETKCNSLLNGVYLFTDQDHLSTAGNQFLIPSLTKQILK